MYYLAISFVFILIAIYRPTIPSKAINIIQSNTKIMVAFDISASMQCNDIYHSRLSFAQKKFYDLLDKFESQKIGVLGFSNQSYLISPITNDYDSLKYIIGNLNIENINKKGSNILDALKSTNNILKQQDKKALIVFTDGTNNIDFIKEIQYAKQNNISVYIYTIATKKGGVINIKDKILKHSNGDIVITSLNDSIEELALKTGGIYKHYSLEADDIDSIVKDIKVKFKSDNQTDDKISNDKELFYIPLGFAFIFFFLSVIAIRGKKL